MLPLCVSVIFPTHHTTRPLSPLVPPPPRPLPPIVHPPPSLPLVPLPTNN